MKMHLRKRVLGLAWPVGPVRPTSGQAQWFGWAWPHWPVYEHGLNPLPPLEPPPIAPGYAAIAACLALVHRTPMLLRRCSTAPGHRRPCSSRAPPSPCPLCTGHVRRFTGRKRAPWTPCAALDSRLAVGVYDTPKDLGR